MMLSLSSPFGGQRRSMARSTVPDDQRRGGQAHCFPQGFKQLNVSSISPDHIGSVPTNSAHPMAAPSHDDGLFRGQNA
jgi:hypothetical protein